MESDNSSIFRIVMFPWLAHGHIFPYLELAKRILKKKNFHIYLCSTPIHFTSINNFLHTNSLQNSITFAELHLHPTPQLPAHLHTTKNLPSHLIFPLIKTFQSAKSSFQDIITALKPDLIIFDVFQPWAATLAASLAIPVVMFSVVGAATMALNYQHYTRWSDDFPFPELHVDDHAKKNLDGFMQFMYVNVFDQDKDIFLVNFRLSSEIVLVKTSQALEGKYIDYFSAVCGKKLQTVGPLVSEAAEEDDEASSEILHWLSKKTPNSTAYISFGSEVFLSEREIEEMKKGLELCRANFIWVVRFPLTEERVTVEKSLQGFLDRVGERGNIVMGWAPQMSILRHVNTGAFVSHCGWSSLNESLYFGVPVVGLPMIGNMFIDAKMLVHAGACLEVGRDENGGFRGAEIAEAIDNVVFGETGQELRRRAGELSEKMREEEEREIEQTAENLWRLCCKNRSKEL